MTITRTFAAYLATLFAGIAACFYALTSAVWIHVNTAELGGLIPPLSWQLSDLHDLAALGTANNDLALYTDGSTWVILVLAVTLTVAGQWFGSLWLRISGAVASLAGAAFTGLILWDMRGIQSPGHIGVGPWLALLGFTLLAASAVIAAAVPEPTPPPVPAGVEYDPSIWRGAS